MIKNEFVDFINQFYSQHLSQSAGYAELSEEKLEGISLKVDNLIDDVVNGKVYTIILTGNAGDGKTFVCNQVYKRLTGSSFPNETILQGKSKNGNSLNIVKDASEVPEEELELFLMEMEKNLSNEEDRNHTIYILAGNEGKLSEVFDKFNLPSLQILLGKALWPYYEDEVDNNEELNLESASAKVLNFNWRDLTEANAFKSIIKAFVRDEIKWESVCNKCEDSNDCPIYLNVQFLRDESIIERIQTLLKFFRYIEGHFTLRELLSAISYFLTAGKNCKQIKLETEKRRQLNYLFYNNVFSIHNIRGGESNRPMDRILRRLQTFDVAIAPLARVNRGVISEIKRLKNVKTPLESETYPGQSDLRLFKKQLSEKDAIERTMYDTFKRRLFFCGSKSHWGDNNYLRLSHLNLVDIDYRFYLTFAGYKEFDDFLSKKVLKESDKYENFKTTIIKGLNLLANRDDDTPDFWLKVYKPSQNRQSSILELFGDSVETISTFLSVKKPGFDSQYIEFANTEIYFSVLVENSEKNTTLRLPVTIELYEGLRTAALGNQSKQALGYLERVIREFRESLYFVTLKSIGTRKFKLNIADELRPMEVFTGKDRVMIRR